ncbi:MAG: uracil-DNA glycosylase [Eikenella sp.]|nr:uracil-DNA glycosylase [Eikenella sp.]
MPEPPAETALQAARCLWAARTPATFTDLPQLRQQAADCTACKLHGERKQALAGHGALPAEVLVLCLNPTLHDDDARQLFSGSHGRLLDNMLAAIGLDAAPIFRTAWLRCTPRISPKPSPEEQVACAAFLEQEWAWAQPKAVLLLGDGFRDEVQQWLVKQIIGSTPCFILPHPAALLRQPLLKAQAWPVLQALRRALDHAPQAA